MGPEWDEDNVYITGHADGSLRLWSIRVGDKPEAADADADAAAPAPGGRGIKIRRPMRLRTSIQVSTAAVTSIAVDDTTGQTMWLGDAKGKVFAASVAGSMSGGAVGFNAMRA